MMKVTPLLSGSLLKMVSVDSRYIILIVIAICLAIGSLNRNAVWHDDIGLWGDTVKKSPNKARPNYELGVSYSEINNAEKAFYYMKRAGQLDARYIRKWLIKR